MFYWGCWLHPGVVRGSWTVALLLVHWVLHFVWASPTNCQWPCLKRLAWALTTPSLAVESLIACCKCLLASKLSYPKIFVFSCFRNLISLICSFDAPKAALGGLYCLEGVSWRTTSVILAREHNRRSQGTFESTTVEIRQEFCKQDWSWQGSWSACDHWSLLTGRCLLDRVSEICARLSTLTGHCIGRKPAALKRYYRLQRRAAGLTWWVSRHIWGFIWRALLVILRLTSLFWRTKAIWSFVFRIACIWYSSSRTATKFKLESTQRVDQAAFKQNCADGSWGLFGKDVINVWRSYISPAISSKHAKCRLERAARWGGRQLFLSLSAAHLVRGIDT